MIYEIIRNPVSLVDPGRQMESRGVLTVLTKITGEEGWG
jgi:hypothetical protein